MAIKTPVINRIIRMTEFDQLRTSNVPGNMYMCEDSRNLYYDETINNRVKYDYIGVNTVNDLFNSITPQSGSTYYCWEDNSLWLWMNKWISLYTDSTYPSAYGWLNPNDPTSGLDPVYGANGPYALADDNGLLKDGSVIVRDRNRIIKGKIYIEDSNDNLVIGSFLGGGIRLLPNGRMSTDGELLINDQGESFIRSAWITKNHEMYVDYSELDEHEDPSEHPNTNHKYKVYHEGNLDISSIKEMSSLDIYNKLLDKKLPNPFEFNVRYLGGKESNEFADKIHTHTASDITDFEDKARAESKKEVKTIFNNMVGEGILITYDEKTSGFKMSANSFTINLGGGVTGSVTIEHLTDSYASIEVDPSKHIHRDYVDTLNNLQDQIDGINAINPANYYTKGEVNDKLTLQAGTENPVIGRPLLVNADLILPGTSLNTKGLLNAINIQLSGDITGLINTDLSSNVNIITNADNILSETAEEGKAVKVDSHGNINVNSTSASQLNHIIDINLQGEVLGSAQLDTSLDSIIINTTLIPGDNIIQNKDLGIKVASLDEHGKVPASQLPASQVGISPVGYWNPNNGTPSESVIEGQYYIADTEGIFESNLYQVGDWCLYYNSQWNHISNNTGVISVNGHRGVVILEASDINALGSDYIDYTLGDTIPQNKLVLTSRDGVIEGASVDHLTDEFNILTNELGDIKLSNDSIKTSTNGSENLNLKFEITENGYESILDNVGFEIYNNSNKLEHKRRLNIGEGLNVEIDATSITISNNTSNMLLMYLDMSESGWSKFVKDFTKAYDNRAVKPILLFSSENTDEYSIYKIDEKCPDITEGLQITLTSYITSNLGYSSAYTINNETVVKNVFNTITLEFTTVGENLELSSITKGDTEVNYPKYLSTDASNLNSNTTAFIPTLDCHPATKKYVDNKTDISKKVYTAKDVHISYTVGEQCVVGHNLHSENVIIQFRDSNTKELVFIQNSIRDEDSIRLHFDQDTDITIDILIIKVD